MYYLGILILQKLVPGDKSEHPFAGGQTKAAASVTFHYRMESAIPSPHTWGSTFPRDPLWCPLPSVMWGGMDPPVVLSGGDEAGHIAQDASTALNDGQRVALALVGQCAHEEAQGTIHLAEGCLVLRAVCREVPQGTEHTLQRGLLGTGVGQVKVMEGASGTGPTHSALSFKAQTKGGKERTKYIFK